MVQNTFLTKFRYQLVYDGSLTGVPLIVSITKSIYNFIFWSKIRYFYVNELYSFIKIQQIPSILVARETIWRFISRSNTSQHITEFRLDLRYTNVSCLYLVVCDVTMETTSTKQKTQTSAKILRAAAADQQTLTFIEKSFKGQTPTSTTSQLTNGEPESEPKQISPLILNSLCTTHTHTHNILIPSVPLFCFSSAVSSNNHIYIHHPINNWDYPHDYPVLSKSCWTPDYQGNKHRDFRLCSILKIRTWVFM